MARTSIATPAIILSLALLLSLASLSAAGRSPRWVPRFVAQSSRHHKSHLNTQYQYQTKYFDQRLDHFSFADLPTFRQRYLISVEHWTGPAQLGPIFLYCGNEGDIELFAANTGLVWDLASQFGAMVVFPEHRYYGKSMPYRDEAYANATTLAYLTAEQALADFVVLITELKKNFSAEASPVVLFGGSYGGMLAAWMRLKYPHIAIGALASSAPVLQFEDIIPPETFYNILSDGFRRESANCFNTIKQSWDVLVSESQKNDGLLKLTKRFHFCEELKSVEDLSNWLFLAYSYLGMVNYPYPANFTSPLPGEPIKEVCRKIDNCPDGTSLLDRIFEGISVYYNYTGKVHCFKLDLDDDPVGIAGWDWQACTEMVMPMSSDPKTSMFPASDFNYTSYQEECWNSYSVKPRPSWITMEFGGHDFKTALKLFGSNIIFSNGLLDPWSGGGVLEDVSETIVALVTEKGAHHLDLRPATAEDPDWLTEQRQTEVKLIKSWLDNYYQEKKGFSAL